MNLIKTIGTALLLFVASFSLKAQTEVVSDSYKTVRLTQQQIEQICTLESTGIDTYYRIKRTQESLRKSSSAKKSNIQVFYVNRSIWPAQAIAAFEYAVSIWETHLYSEVPIRIEANWVELGERTLGSAGPTQIVSITEGEPQTWYSIALGSAMSGIDFVEESQGTENEVDYDITVNMNSAWNQWYFGTDAETPQGLIDFVTVVLHELGHGLGFIGSVSVLNSGSASWGYGNPAWPIIYDRFVMDGRGVDILNRQVYTNPSPLLFDAVTGKRGGLFFAGINAITANKGQAVRLYAPSDWNGGSSYSHVDLQTYTNTENALMRPQIDRAFAVHAPGAIACSMFGDMGWPLTENCESLIGSESYLSLSNLDDMHLNFGVTNANKIVKKSFRIENSAHAKDPLVGRVVVASGKKYSVEHNARIITLAPGEAVDVNVSYLPDMEGKSTGEIQVIHNAENVESPIQIELVGEALAKDETFKLEPNYPNPFNPSTTIPYALSKTAQVKLDVFDALGRHVQTLVDGQQNSGRYYPQFRANDISSGVYIYRLIVDNKSETGKLLLAK